MEHRDQQKVEKTYPRMGSIYGESLSKRGMVASLMLPPTPSLIFSLWNIPLPQVLSPPLHSSPRPPTLYPCKYSQQLQSVAHLRVQGNSASHSPLLALDVAVSCLKLFLAESPTRVRTHISDVWLLGLLLGCVHILEGSLPTT